MHEPPDKYDGRIREALAKGGQRYREDLTLIQFVAARTLTEAEQARLASGISGRLVGDLFPYGPIVESDAGWPIFVTQDHVYLEG